MRFTGRVVSLIVFIPSSLAWGICTTYLFGSLMENWMHLSLFIIFELAYAIVGLRIGNKYDKAKFHSEKDDLTGMNNRRYARFAFPKILRKINQKKGFLGVIVIDVDNYKTINDTYGHAMGDKVLVQIVKTIKKTVRKSDVAARWGGDEFLLIIPALDKQFLHTLMERLSKEIEKINHFKEISGYVSASMGISIYPEDAKTLDNLIQIADKNMYINKKQRKVIMINVSTNQLSTNQDEISI
jgi:diguanylate cyclase (GGDEF)-like protein